MWQASIGVEFQNFYLDCCWDYKYAKERLPLPAVG